MTLQAALTAFGNCTLTLGALQVAKSYEACRKARWQSECRASPPPQQLRRHPGARASAGEAGQLRGRPRVVRRVPGHRGVPLGADPRKPPRPPLLVAASRPPRTTRQSIQRIQPSPPAPATAPASAGRNPRSRISSSRARSSPSSPRRQSSSGRWRSTCRSSRATGRRWRSSSGRRRRPGRCSR